MSGDTQAKLERDLATARRDAAKWRRRHARLRAGLAKLLEQDTQDVHDRENEARQSVTATL